MLNENPFVVILGKQPINYIPRYTEYNEIKDNFEQSTPSIQDYLITGIRGSGKTVLLSSICSFFEKKTIGS